jgi:hypothetical protein
VTQDDVSNMMEIPVNTEQDYERLLVRAGARSLDAADRAALIPALRYMDAKVSLLRRKASESPTGFVHNPASE